MVQNSDWGPPLWRILHTLAERLGRQTVPLLQMDEFRLWASILEVTEGIMPCALCRNHYRGWKLANPPAGIISYGGRGGAQAREEARRRLWALHNKVNAQRGQPEFPFEELEATYGPEARPRQALQEDINILLKVLGDAALQRLIDGAHVRTWKGRVGMLRHLLGI